jgi:hypothetical protein
LAEEQKAFQKDCAAWSWHEIYAQVNTAYSSTNFPTLFVVCKFTKGRNFWNASYENILWMEERRNCLRIVFIGGIGSVCVKYSYSLDREFFMDKI